MHRRPNGVSEPRIPPRVKRVGDLDPWGHEVRGRRPLGVQAHNSCSFSRALASTKASAARGVDPVARTEERIVRKEGSLGWVVQTRNVCAV